MKLKLDKEEKAILRAVEKNGFNSVKNIAAEKKRYAVYAKHTLVKNNKNR